MRPENYRKFSREIDNLQSKTRFFTPDFKSNWSNFDQKSRPFEVGRRNKRAAILRILQRWAWLWGHVRGRGVAVYRLLLYSLHSSKLPTCWFSKAWPNLASCLFFIWYEQRLDFCISCTRRLICFLRNYHIFLLFPFLTNCSKFQFICKLSSLAFDWFHAIFAVILRNVPKAVPFGAESKKLPKLVFSDLLVSARWLRVLRCSVAICPTTFVRRRSRIFSRSE